MELPKHFGERVPAIFADSGAFSAYTQGAVLHWKEYAAWLKRWKHWIEQAANLDVIGNVTEGLTNQHRLEDAGCQVLPVFHTGEPWSILERLIDEYPYIALGGMVPYIANRKNTMGDWLLRCFRMAQGRSVFHGFGLSSWPLTAKLPWYSVDSTSWLYGAKRRNLALFNPYAKAMKKHNLLTLDGRGTASRVTAYYDPAMAVKIVKGTIQWRDLYVLGAQAAFLAAGWITKTRSTPEIPIKETPCTSS